MQKVFTNMLYQSEYVISSKKNSNKSLSEIIVGCGASLDAYGFRTLTWDMNPPQTLNELNIDSAYVDIDVPYMNQDNLHVQVEMITEGKNKKLHIGFCAGDNPLTHNQARWISHVVNDLIVGKKPKYTFSELKWKLINNEKFTELTLAPL